MGTHDRGEAAAATLALVAGGGLLGVYCAHLVPPALAPAVAAAVVLAILILMLPSTRRRARKDQGWESVEDVRLEGMRRSIRRGTSLDAGVRAVPVPSAVPAPAPPAEDAAEDARAEAEAEVGAGEGVEPEREQQREQQRVRAPEPEPEREPEHEPEPEPERERERVPPEAEAKAAVEANADAEVEAEAETEERRKVSAPTSARQLQRGASTRCPAEAWAPLRIRRADSAPELAGLPLEQRVEQAKRRLSATVGKTGGTGGATATAHCLRFNDARGRQVRYAARSSRRRGGGASLELTVEGKPPRRVRAITYKAVSRTIYDNKKRFVLAAEDAALVVKSLGLLCKVCAVPLEVTEGVAVAPAARARRPDLPQLAGSSTSEKSRDGGTTGDAGRPTDQVPS